MKTLTKWTTGKKFESEQNGAIIKLDSNAGFSPKALLLTGLAGCTGVDIVEILEKMRLPFSDLTMEVEADQTDEHPRVFKDIHIIYRIGAEESERARIIKAVELSLEKYCGVAEMLRKNSKITYSLEIVNPQ